MSRSFKRVGLGLAAFITAFVVVLAVSGATYSPNLNIPAGVGVRTLCVGTWRTAFLPVETEYITFRRGEVAAVRLTSGSPLFEKFAASIRHTALSSGGSRVTYTYSFETRPRLVAALVEPIVGRRMARETRARLMALRDYVEQRVSDAKTFDS